MKKALIIILVLVVTFALAGAGVVSAFGEAKNLPLPKAYVFSVRGDAKIKSINTDWQTPEVNQVIKIGDSIKTGNDGEVSINFFSNSTSRIGPNTETTITEAQIDKFNYAKTQVGLTVTLGRVWSRIINLSDREATFEVGSNSTVATVRGTTINFERTQDGLDKINAVESVVNVSIFENATSTEPNQKRQKILKTINLAQGSQAVFDPKAIKKDVLVELTPKEILQTTWFKGNSEQDIRFEEEIKILKEQQNKELAGTLPDSPFYKIKKIAEEVRLALTLDPENKKALEVSFLNRRLAESQALIEAGKTGLAEIINQEFKNQAQNFLNNLKSIPNKEKIDELQGQLQNQINLQNDLLLNLAPDMPGYNIKQSLDEFKLKNAPSEEDKKYLLYKDAQQSLKEADILKQQGNKELFDKQMKTYNEAVKSLEQFKNPELLDQIKLLENSLSQLKDINLDNKTIEQLKLPTDLNNQIQNAQKIIEENLKNIPTEQPIITEPLPKPIIPPVTEKPPVQPVIDPLIKPIGPITPPTEKKLTTLVIVANKYNMLANASMQFIAIANYSDGTKQNVSNQAVWSVSGDIGSITSSGLLQTNANGGSGRVSATYSENGVTVSGSSPTVTSLTIEQ